jgi:hypothetical protein
MSSTPLSRFATPCTLLLALALFGYTVARAMLLSLNNDEALTFLYHARSSALDIIQYNSKIMPSNNHMLNSLLMKLSTTALGTSELALRLPNVLAQLPFLAFSFLIVRRYLPPALALAGFLVINATPYFIEFFSLSRGYGIAMGCMMSSLYFCLRYLEARRWAPLLVFLSSLFAMIAVFASIPFLDYYLALAGVLGVITLCRHRPIIASRDKLLPWLGGVLRDVAPLAANSAVLAAVMLPIIVKLRAVDHFYTGGKIGFWEDTVMSLVDGSLYRLDYDDAVRPVLQGTVVLVSLFNAWLFCRAVRRPFEARSGLTLVVVPLLFMIAIGSILEHQLFGVNYLKGRIGVMFIPLFLLSFVGAAGYLATICRTPVWRRFGATLLVVAALGVGIHALNAFNLTHSTVLRGNASTRQMMDDLQRHFATEFRATPGEEIRLGVSSIYKPVVSYYVLSRQLDWLEVVEIVNPRQDYDYYYYDQDDGRVLNTRNLIRLRTYPITSAVLATKVPD